MTAHETARNYATQYAIFAIDSDSDSDLKCLPTQERSGSGDLALSKPCCLGSLAKCSNGKTYFLNSKNEWKAYSGSSSGGGGSGGGSPSPEEVQPIGDDDISSLFDFGG